MNALSSSVARLAPRILAIAVGLSAAGLASAAEPACRLSLLEGEATVIEGAAAVAGAAGMALKATAIVDTAADTRLLRVECADGSVTDLGPATRAMFAPRGFAPRSGQSPQWYVLAGWLKQASGPTSPTPGMVTRTLDVLPFTGTVVLHAAAPTQQLFVEAGRTQVTERRRGAVPQPVAAGEFYTGDATGPGALQPRPAADFISALPRLFRDRIPSRPQRPGEAPVQGTALPEPSYASLRDWLTAEPLIRRDFPRRFVALARSPAFRKALDNGLAQHPEWTPVLYPPPPVKP